MNDTVKNLYKRTENPEGDFYSTPPNAVKELLNLEVFGNDIWECCCGNGAISKVLESKGFNVKSTDLFDRGYGEAGVDFLNCQDVFNGDIITNPPYKGAVDFARKALELVPEGHKVAMFLRIQFLETVKRYELFKENPPYRIYISVRRLNCWLNGEVPDRESGLATYCWIVWNKGYKGRPEITWFNYEGN